MTSTGGHPSQAEGEDPDRPDEGGGSGATGRPSQAEGDDPKRPRPADRSE